MSDVEDSKKSEAKLPFGKKFKHTLDSDESDDEVDADKTQLDQYRMDEIEGMEKATIDFDGDIKITPFNMDEELETGHFDKEGMYIPKKDEEANIRDNWMDNIDWAKIQQNPDSSRNLDSDKNNADDDAPSEVTSTEELYKQIVELVRPGESIQRAIQRFGKDCPKIVRKGQKRKFDSETTADDSKAKAAKESIMKLTSIADQLLQKGDMDIYERKYEEFQLHLNRNKMPFSSDDMFSDDFDPSSSKPSTSAADASSDDPLISTVTWEFKWEDKLDAPVYGPYKSEDMQAWVDSGYFKDGCFVRRADPNSNSKDWVSSKRIDFEIYY